MRLSVSGGKPVLDKAEVTRMIESVWIVRALERDQPETPEKARALSAAGVIESLAKAYGPQHFDAAGNIKTAPSKKKQEQEPQRETELLNPPTETPAP